MRASLLGVSLSALLACGGAEKPAPDRPDPGKPGSDMVTKAQPAAPPCPEEAITPTVGKVGDPPLAEDDYRAAEVQACVYLGPDRWFVIGSIGDRSPDSQSEEGWEIVRFIADDAGAVKAAGPSGGASWMTGVPEGAYETADLDGDGSPEVLERIDIYVADPSQSTEILRVYAVRGDKVEIVFSSVLADGDQADPEGGQVCRARYTVAEAKAGGAPRKTIDIEVTSGPEREEIEPGDIVLEATDGRESVQCLPVGRFTFSYAGGEMTGAPVAKKAAPAKPAAK